MLVPSTDPTAAKTAGVPYLAATVHCFPRTNRAAHRRQFFALTESAVPVQTNALLFAPVSILLAVPLAPTVPCLMVALDVPTAAAVCLFGVCLASRRHLLALLRVHATLQRFRHALTDAATVFVLPTHPCALWTPLPLTLAVPPAGISVVTASAWIQARLVPPFSLAMAAVCLSPTNVATVLVLLILQVAPLLVQVPHHTCAAMEHALPTKQPVGPP
jgi:hypothetical protein